MKCIAIYGCLHYVSNPGYAVSNTYGITNNTTIFATRLAVFLIYRVISMVLTQIVQILGAITVSRVSGKQTPMLVPA